MQQQTIPVALLYQMLGERDVQIRLLQNQVAALERELAEVREAVKESKEELDN